MRQNLNKVKPDESTIPPDSWTNAWLPAFMQLNPSDSKRGWARIGVLLPRISTYTFPLQQCQVQRRSLEAWEDHPHRCPRLHWGQEPSHHHHHSLQHKPFFSGLADLFSSSLLSFFWEGTTRGVGIRGINLLASSNNKDDKLTLWWPDILHDSNTLIGIDCKNYGSVFYTDHKTKQIQDWVVTVTEQTKTQSILTSEELFHTILKNLKTKNNFICPV